MLPCSSSHRTESNSSIVLPEQPHQPQKYSFPKCSFGIKRVVERSFRPSWFSTWNWLHYIEDKDVVLCFTCARASQEKKLQWSVNTADLAFTSRGSLIGRMLQSSLEYMLLLSATKKQL